MTLQEKRLPKRQLDENASLREITRLTSFFAMSLEDLRQEVLRKCDVIQALLTFNYHHDSDTLRDITTLRHAATFAPSKVLRGMRKDLDQNIRTAAKIFGLKESPTKFARSFQMFSRTKEGQVLHLSKAHIDELFSNFGDDPKTWQRFPPHALFMLDFSGELTQPRAYEYYLPEAVFYEDMCLAFNTALDTSNCYAARPIVKKYVKTHTLNVRTSILSSFYFVEAYLNGIAFDFVVQNEKNVDAKTKEVLLEQDSTGTRERWVNFRDKALQFPKLILGLQHPPLTETNCSAFGTLLSQGKRLRDALVHQSPKRLSAHEESDKVRALVGLRFKMRRLS